jgi:hypothetical protein
VFKPLAESYASAKSAFDSEEKRIADEKAPIGYDKRVQMGILLGIPTDKTLNPQFIASMQSTFGKPPTDGPQTPQPAGAPKRQLKLADNLKLANR